MLLAVTGLNGSGKDAVANYLKEKHGFTHISLSNLVVDLVKEAGLDPSDRDNLNKIADQKRKELGPDFLAKKALENYYSEEKLVLSSFRHPKEIEAVKQYGGIITRVDVNLETRFKRTKKRKELDENDYGSVTIEDFKLKEKRELSNPDKDKMQILKVLDRAEVVFQNNETLDELHKQIDEFVKKLLIS